VLEPGFELVALPGAGGDVLGHMGGDDDHAFGVADQDVARLDQDAAAADGQAEVGRVVQHRAGGAVGPGRVGGEVQGGDGRGVAQGSVGDQAGRAPDHQAGGQDVAQGGRAELAAGVDDQHLVRADGLDRDPLGVGPVVVLDLEVQVLAGRDVAQGEGVAHHPPVRPQRPDPGHERVAEAELEQLAGEAGGGDFVELAPGVR
jgi:hypothetical protein